MKERKISYEVVIGKDQVSVDECIDGEKISPSLFVGTPNSYDIAQACRKAAYALLERADGIQHNQDFYHEFNIREQINLMREENRD